MTEKIRIQKLLSEWGVASRRAVEKLIENGKIKVDGKVLREQGLLLDPENPPEIVVDGKIIKKPAKKSNSIYIFHKPEGVVSTLSDELGRKSIKDFLPPGKRLYPIGRLDSDSSGLLLITDHGELTHRLLHPSFKVEKEYIVKIDGSSLSRSEREQFRAGVILEDGKTAPCLLRQLKNPQIYSVVIKEGKKRQIRKMFETFNRKVVSLHRIRFGPIRINDLRPGDIRLLSAKEKADLLKAAGLKN